MRKRGTEQRRIAVAGVLTVVLFAAQALAAALPGFDLDLKELKKPAPPLPAARKSPPPKQERTAARPAPEKAAARKNKPATAKTVAKPVEALATPAASTPAEPAPTPQSSYTVAAGETLYGVLTRQYGLSSDAANRLMPVVVQQNRLDGAASLTAGQKLLIPLAMPATAPTVVAPPVTVAAASPAERVVFLDAGSACPLARQVMGAVAQPVDPQELLHDVALPAVAAARFEGIIAVLACELPRAEEYTYRRLLEMQGTQLISLSGDDPLPQAIQAVLDALGLSYRRPAGVSDSYLVRQADSTEQLLRLTISKHP